ncbi:MULTISPECIES: hypothetical protein [Pedobacter]|uniref:Uncharacterized protein n=1 Tax=Pedobacter heparinus (strain ATCC 13125 / DSM 2366 / CIP 104194 / JCM 7457 / NBRC 12017 / NCIMB 9290 / NRRL B-14731 / HIM 762-3) TaxID=485917 RepID=C6XZS7_PEDHD|nr:MULTISPECIES: hypothetical protein [Pedobacter]ACU02622.1 hypothetical protein Phep_0398 [Pedobacter heparinus DSM 2366]MBB5439887.1 putative membrane protein [Pedobacter sp. AK017]
MEQTPKHNTESMKRANEISIYKLMVVGILISILGVYLRFAGDSTTLSIVSWVILFVGSIVACKGVFKILAA